jgi:EF-P beta-lysylation protein EpmB
MNIVANNPPAVRALSKETVPREPSWQTDIRTAIRDAYELCRLLELPAELADAATAGAREFPLFVPPAYLDRIRRGDPHDPLLRQVLPLEEETTVVAGFTHDPVDDRGATLQPGVLQKYAGRALLITTGACAVHCRYCFRRHFPYEVTPHSESAWDAALGSIAKDDGIHEVILSGGDPLMLRDERLAWLSEKIAAIEHVARLRVHTRLPVMIPSRVTDALVAWLTGTRLTPVLVIHANHARELDDAVADCLIPLRQAGVMLLNQAVLLRGINDSLPALAALSERLIALGVVPYYLHQLDQVAGAAHFEVPIDQGRRLMHQLRAQLPGYLIPQYVQEIPGEPHKTVLA